MKADMQQGYDMRKPDKLNADGSNPNYYLPSEVPIVNAYRAAKGDIKRIGEEIRARHWMPDLLFDAGHFSKENVDTCFSFFAILTGARRTLGICDLLNAITNKAALEYANADVDAFLEIKRGLTLPEMNMLIWVVDNNLNHENIPLAYHLLGTIKHGAEKAQKIIVDLAENKRRL
jgi:hypothetical protein